MAWTLYDARRDAEALADAGDLFDHVNQGLALIGTGRDVEKGDLVGALLIVFIVKRLSWRPVSYALLAVLILMDLLSLLLPIDASQVPPTSFSPSCSRPLPSWISPSPVS